MAIIAADLRFLSSERMTDALVSAPDTSSGGGFAALPVVQDGVSNNVFPDVMPSDRLTGRRQMRLVYPAILSNENSLGANLQYAEVERPSDASVEVVAFSAAFTPAQATADYAPGGVFTPAQKRSAYWAGLALEQYHVEPAVVGAAVSGGTDSATLSGYTGTALVVGEKVQIRSGGGSSTLADWRTVTAFNAGAGTVSFSGAVVWPAGLGVQVRRYGVMPFQLSCPMLLTAQLNAGGQNASVDRLECRVQPVGANATTPGLSAWLASAQATLRGGVAPAFEVGRKVLLQHPSTPATREVRVVESINYATGVVRLTAGTTNTYPIGSVISTLLDLGDAQARVSLTPFYQQAWTRSWANAAIGLGIAAGYSGTIAMNNAGGSDDRWAIVFTSATAFECHSERLGLIAIGNTGSNFSPLNPVTSQPYFTLAAAGWTAGWLPGNTMRFNTAPANAGVWRSRVVSAGATSGSAQGAMALRVDVDA